MVDDNYELVPSEKLRELKKQLDSLKKSSVSGNSSDLAESMDNLSTNINRLLEIFREATEEMKIEEKEELLIKKKLEPLLKKMDVVADNTQTIANALVDINDKLDAMKNDIEILKRQSSRTVIQQSPAPEPKIEPAPLPKMAPIPPLPTQQQTKPDFKW